MSSEPSPGTSAGIKAPFSFEQLEDGPVIAGTPSDLLAGAWVQAERIQEQARQTGLAQGRAEGLASAHQEVELALSALAQALAALQALREQLTLELEHDATELAFRLGEQILAGALDVQPQRVADVARNALRRVTDRRRVVLLVNPQDLELMSGAVSSLKAELGGIEHCDVQSDRRIARGGVILRTEAGEIDATIDLQLERAREIVAEALQDDRDAG